ncbi:6-O-methylguanine DNA methyltransferase [Chaetomium sp. MPI-SDFR-AT-0129]|nr:6-O-methylguanine DNA methyltransferase [Chaetomium sp. MPI-SDFR-AT-0129]
MTTTKSTTKTTSPATKRRSTRAKTTATATTTMPTTLPKFPSKLPPKTNLPLPPPLQASPRGTPFERAVWALTYQIPPGSFSTYALLAAHLKSSPRAVGNALRRNPFAPEIPCHRVVATGGGLGGFKGKIARRDGEGITLAEKRSLLRKEGVKLVGVEGGGRGGGGDEVGEVKVKVLGTAFGGFV